MKKLVRRKWVEIGPWLAALSLATCLSLGCGRSEFEPTAQVNHQTPELERKPAGEEMQIYYLEIVTKEVEATRKLYSAMHDIPFKEPDPNLGNAWTAKLAGGGMLGIRAPMHDAEKPVTRPYMLVTNIESAVKAASDAGATVAVPPMKLAGHGTCAILIQNGVELGLWQLDTAQKQ